MSQDHAPQEVERVTYYVDPESPLGRAMAEARESWGEAGPPDPDAFEFPKPRRVTDFE